MPFTKENAGEYARRRWAKYTPEERSEHGRMMARIGKNSWVARKDRANRALLEVWASQRPFLEAELKRLEAQLNKNEFRKKFGNTP